MKMKDITPRRLTTRTMAALRKKNAVGSFHAMTKAGIASKSAWNIDIIDAVIHFPSLNSDGKCLVTKHKYNA
jgi:hypothetical protein